MSLGTGLVILASCRPGCFPFPPLSSLCSLYLATGLLKLLCSSHCTHFPVSFPGTAHSNLRLLVSAFGRKLSAVVSLTMSSRLGYFPWSPWTPPSRPDTLPSPSLGRGTISVSQSNFVGTDISREQNGLVKERRTVCLFLLESAQVMQCH